MTKEVDERIDEGLLGWFGHVERMEKDIIAKRVYVGEYAGSRSVDMPRKSWIDTVVVTSSRANLTCLLGSFTSISRARPGELFTFILYFFFNIPTSCL